MFVLILTVPSLCAETWHYVGKQADIAPRSGDEKVPSYGFKLLEVQLFRGKGRQPLDFGSPDGKKQDNTHYLDLVVSDFSAEEDALNAPAEPDGSSAAADAIAANERTLESVALGSEDVVSEDPDSGVPEEEGRKQLAVVRIQSALRHKNAVLLDTVYGIVGDHALAVDPGGEKKDTDLSKLATTRHYRALLIAPPQGKNGFLAVEVVSRSHAGSRLPSRLHAGVKGHNFKIRTFGAVADEESVTNLAKDSRIREVNLFQTLPSSDSSQSKTIPAKLTFSIGANSVEEETLRERAASWLPTKKNKAKKVKPEAAKEAEALASYLWPELSNACDFEGAELVIEGNQRKRLRPLDMASGFTYDMGDVRPDDHTFIYRVSEVVDRLAATHSVNLDRDWTVPSTS